MNLFIDTNFMFIHMGIHLLSWQARFSCFIDEESTLLFSARFAQSI